MRVPDELIGTLPDSTSRDLNHRHPPSPAGGDWRAAHRRARAGIGPAVFHPVDWVVTPVAESVCGICRSLIRSAGGRGPSHDSVLVDLAHDTPLVPMQPQVTAAAQGDQILHVGRSPVFVPLIRMMEPASFPKRAGKATPGNGEAAFGHGENGAFPLTGDS